MSDLTRGNFRRRTYREAIFSPTYCRREIFFADTSNGEIFFFAYTQKRLFSSRVCICDCFHLIFHSHRRLIYYIRWKLHSNCQLIIKLSNTIRICKTNINRDKQVFNAQWHEPIKYLSIFQHPFETN